MDGIKELKMFVLAKMNELKHNPHKESVRDYTSGCLDMVTEIMNKIDEIEHPERY